MRSESLEDRWLEQLAGCAAILRRERRWPERASEPELFNWLNAQKRALADGKLSPTRRALLNRHLPTWSVRQRLSPGGAFEATVAFIEKKNRAPRPRDSEEAARYISLQKMRIAAREGSLDPALLERLEATGVHWRGRGVADAREGQTSFDAHWLERLEQLRLFVEETGHMPRRGSAHAGDAERQLGYWIENQRRALMSPTARSMSEERLAALNDAIADWLDIRV